MKSAAKTSAPVKTQAAKSKPSKREAILNAMLDIVVERGFHDAPMSLVARRSGASAGVIYHYFASKEEIIAALYDRIRSVKQASILAGYTPEMPAKEALLLVAWNSYRFYRQQSKELRFLEQYEHAGFPCKPESNTLGTAEDEDLAAFERRFSGRENGGLLENWPPAVLHEMTLGLVIRLARLPEELSHSLFHEISARVWDSIKATD